jgi:hypothetical protein
VLIWRTDHQLADQQRQVFQTVQYRSESRGLQIPRLLGNRLRHHWELSADIAPLNRRPLEENVYHNKLLPYILRPYFHLTTLASALCPRHKILTPRSIGKPRDRTRSPTGLTIQQVHQDSSTPNTCPRGLTAELTLPFSHSKSRVVESF